MSNLKTMLVDFAGCTVTTKARTTSNIPAGRHFVVESQTHGGGVTINWAGCQIDIDYSEWKRLIDAGLVREV